MENYHDKAIRVYGEKCEWIGCGWNEGYCDVHHIDYQEQQAAERKFRDLLDNGQKDSEEWKELEAFAIRHGWGTFDVRSRQLHKNDATTNLTVLCPNHHRFAHTKDLGIKILQYRPPRK